MNEATQHAPNNNKCIMSFVMPPSFDVTTLPEPSDPLIIIESIPANKVAILRYAGG
jgi:hypothetical protein